MGEIILTDQVTLLKSGHGRERLRWWIRLRRSIARLLWWVAPSLRETSLLLLGWIDKPTRLGRVAFVLIRTWVLHLEYISVFC